MNPNARPWTPPALLLEPNDRVSDATVRTTEPNEAAAPANELNADETAAVATNETDAHCCDADELGASALEPAGRAVVATEIDDSQTTSRDDEQRGAVASVPEPEESAAAPTNETDAHCCDDEQGVPVHEPVESDVVATEIDANRRNDDERGAVASALEPAESAAVSTNESDAHCCDERGAVASALEPVESDVVATEIDANRRNDDERGAVASALEPAESAAVPTNESESAAVGTETKRRDDDERGAVATALEKLQSGEVSSEVVSSLKESKVRPADFAVVREIGVGAFGRVTLARHGPTGREFAMKAISKKVLRRKKISEREWRLERDVLVHIKAHPYVVELVCAFQTPAYFFLVMKYLSGGELFALMRSRGTFPEDVAAFYAAEVSLALEHLHAAGVIHRDLKPENLLLDGDGHVVVTDFGLAKMCESHEEVHRTLCGTDVYMAPEMVARRAYGAAVDFWSLGVLVYEMLSGKTPFAAPTTKELHRKILTDKVKFPTVFSKDAISCLRALLERQVPKRLGAAKATMFQVGGLAALKAHEFFVSIEWQPLARRESPPPLAPSRPKPVETAAKAPSLDGLSSAISEASEDDSVRDFEFCRDGVFDVDDERRSVLESPTSSQCDVSSACTDSKKKKGPRKRKKKKSLGSEARSSPPPTVSTRLDSIPGSPQVDFLLAGPLPPHPRDTRPPSLPSLAVEPSPSREAAFFTPIAASSNRRRLGPPPSSSS